MKHAALRFAIPVCLLVAGCLEASAPGIWVALPPRTPRASAEDVRHGCPAEGFDAAPGAPGDVPNATSAAAETDVEAAAYQRGLDDAREFEETRICHVVMNLGRPDLALRFMNLYEQRHSVKERDLWEALRVRVLFRLGRADEAEAGAKMWEGTEVGQYIRQQIKLEKMWEGRTSTPKK